MPSLSLGQPVELALRPEKIAITAVEPAGDQYCASEVKDVLYLGQLVKYIVRVPDGTQLTVKQQRGASTAPFSKGDCVRIALRSWDISAFSV
jgi:ABC-type Fe3+/spermidine/putrescine transport system ATPase subunit